MKQSFVAFTLLASTLSLFAGSAHAERITGTDAYYIQVTPLLNGKWVAYDFCSFTTGICHQLGKKSAYSQNALNQLRSSENHDVWFAVLGDVALTAATIASGGIAGYAVGGSLGTAGAFGAAGAGGVLAGTVGGAVVGGVVGGVAGVANDTLIDRMNPHEQYKEAQTLDIRYRTPGVDSKIDYPCEKFKERLERVLSDLE